MKNTLKKVTFPINLRARSTIIKEGEYKVFVTVKIQKKDGTLQDYNRTKLLLSMMRAQASPNEAEQALGAVESWLSQISTDTVNSQDIHAKVMEALKSINP